MDFLTAKYELSLVFIPSLQAGNGMIRSLVSGLCVGKESVNPCWAHVQFEEVALCSPFTYFRGENPNNNQPQIEYNVFPAQISLGWPFNIQVWEVFQWRNPLNFNFTLMCFRPVPRGILPRSLWFAVENLPPTPTRRVIAACTGPPEPYLIYPVPTRLSVDTR